MDQGRLMLIHLRPGPAVRRQATLPPHQKRERVVYRFRSDPHTTPFAISASISPLE
jgi:hypothetical protein